MYPPLGGRGQSTVRGDTPVTTEWEIRSKPRQRSILPSWMGCYGCGADLTVIVTRDTLFLACRCCNAPQASGCTHGGK